ncbi:DUF5694 domain-containing protein [Saprospira grandis]|uniref:TraB family protein n=1 Tax=Saprospira grandis (strain Lewin) TaxID=984262 RepID=H6L0A2_SAPGL|nr:DUF5694 domain-containing protein [Saprospira grandis]AFC26266.1 TraB family protein [Saprospira grandis str. Lewin]WBM74116.1 DUF5694 domain-containing protein [Saprospira grandis]
MKYLLCLSLTFYFSLMLAQQKEIVLVGTMHMLPKRLKNSYKPLFKKSLAYQPEAIFVETVRPEDSLSWAYLKNGHNESLKNFYQYSLKVREEFDFNQDTLEHLLSKDFQQMTKDDFKKICLSFAYQLDYPNFYYYRYVQDYFPEGHKKSKRHENYELSRKLALKLGHKKLYASDDQQTNAEFHQHWQACEKAIDKTPVKRKEKKIIRKIVLREVFPSIFGRYGIVNNKPKHLELLDSLSGLKYTDMEQPDCAKAVDYFKQRNKRFAYNLGRQIEANTFRKNILFVGASHIVGLKKELNKQFPNIKVILFNEL